jgi:hypothetical protein
MFFFNSLYENYHHMKFFFLTYYFLGCRTAFTDSERIFILCLQFYFSLCFTLPFVIILLLNSSINKHKYIIINVIYVLFSIRA